MLKNLLLFILVLVLLACESKKETGTVQQPSELPATDTTQNLPVPPTPVPDSSLIIVPGKRIGQIRIGEASEKIYAALGKPDSGDAAMGKAMSIWLSKSQKSESRHMVAVFFSRKNTETLGLFARQIRVNSPAFKTPEALHTGSSLAEIRKRYALTPLAYYLTKQQQRVYIFDDQAQGIAFEVSTPDSICMAITIHEKGQDITTTYIPLHADLVPLNK